MAVTWNILSALWGTKLLSKNATVPQYAAVYVSAYWLTQDARVLAGYCAGDSPNS